MCIELSKYMWNIYTYIYLVIHVCIYRISAMYICLMFVEDGQCQLGVNLDDMIRETLY